MTSATLALPVPGEVDRGLLRAAGTMEDARHILSAVGLAAGQVLYLFAPLLVSSALSGVVLRYDLVRWLKRPIDGGVTFRGRRLFGDSKTWRGVAVAIVGSIATVLVQKHVLGARAAALWLLDYAHVSPVSLGAAIGGGAMLGELPNSFVKRRLGIAPGSTTKGVLSVLFYVWDQIDLLLGSWPLLFAWVRPSALVLAASFALTLALHPLVSLVGYVIGARRSAR